MSKRIRMRFHGVNKDIISDDEHNEDYRNSTSFERVRIGNLCLYYKNLLKKYYVPYEYIDRVYTKVVVCPENEFANNEEYYKLTLVHNDEDFAELILQKKGTVDAIYRGLGEKNSLITFASK